MNNKTMIIFIIGICVLSFSTGLICGVMQSKDLLNYYEQELSKVNEHIDNFNYNLDSSFLEYNLTTNYSIMNNIIE